ncbi:MAG: RNA polymerase sigma factor [Pirellulales bacterium]
MTTETDDITAVIPMGSPQLERDEGRVLADRFQEGDATAFDDIVAAYQEHMLRLAYRLLGWSPDAEDVVQEVLISALENLGGFRGEARFSTWLTALTVNKCRSHRRRQLLRLRGLTRLASSIRIVSEPRQSDESLEIADQVRCAVQRLSAKCREVVVLRYFEELSVREISEILHIPVNTVETRLSRAGRKLRESLAVRLERGPT